MTTVMRIVMKGVMTSMPVISGLIAAGIAIATLKAARAVKERWRRGFIAAAATATAAEETRIAGV